MTGLALELTCNARKEYTVTVYYPGGCFHIPVSGPATGLDLIRRIRELNRWTNEP